MYFDLLRACLYLAKCVAIFNSFKGGKEKKIHISILLTDILKDSVSQRFVIVLQKIVVVSVSNLQSALFILWLSWGPGKTNELALKLQDSRCRGNIRIYPARQKAAVEFLLRVASMKVSVKEKQGFVILKVLKSPAPGKQSRI